jgi:hypothetical protein
MLTEMGSKEKKGLGEGWGKKWPRSNLRLVPGVDNDGLSRSTTQSACAGRWWSPSGMIGGEGGRAGVWTQQRAVLSSAGIPSNSPPLLPMHSNKPKSCAQLAPDFFSSSSCSRIHWTRGRKNRGSPKGHANARETMKCAPTPREGAAVV